MNCEHFIKTLREKLGDTGLDDEQKAHIEHCPDCAGYLEKLQSLERGLDSVSLEPLTQAEFARIQDSLDVRINRYMNRATGFYRLAVRYGTSLTAVVMIVFVSLLSGVGLHEEADISREVVPVEYIYVSELYDEIEVDDRYLGLAVEDYVRDHGLSAGDVYIGELSADEYEYLANNIDVGGIL